MEPILHGYTVWWISTACVLNCPNWGLAHNAEYLSSSSSAKVYSPGKSSLSSEVGCMKAKFHPDTVARLIWSTNLDQVLRRNVKFKQSLWESINGRVLFTEVDEH